VSRSNASRSINSSTQPKANGLRQLVMMIRTLVVASMLSLAATVPATPQELAFEAASVRANTSGDIRIRASTQGRTYTAVNMPLDRLIAIAYDLQPLMSRLSGGPSWVRSERFDITATLPANTTFRQVPVMLRALLAERFKLAVRSETRDAPAYALVMARSDGRLGPRLLRSTVNCVEEASAGRTPPPRPDGTPACQTQVDSNIQGRGQPLVTLARLLPSFVQRPVVDRTGLSGAFDFDVTVPPQSTAADSDAGGGIVTALQEQLGLKLETTQAPLEFIVIESVEPLTAR
jgi:uncharacterized protein (TIGR03435 family)